MRDSKKQDAGNMQMLELLMVREFETCLSGGMSTKNVQDFRLLRSPAEAGFLQGEVANSKAPHPSCRTTAVADFGSGRHVAGQ